jgi:hypothetical protein
MTIRLGKTKVKEFSAYNKNFIQYYNVNWHTSNFAGAADIGIGAEGHAYVVGLDGKLYSHDFLQNTYTLVGGNTQIPPISRVDVDTDGIPYVVCTTGETYYLDCNNNWIQLYGCARDIGVGRGGEVWKVGCDDREGGYGIWKLFCSCKCDCGCERKCLKYKQMNYVSIIQTIKQSKCFWYRVEGGASRVDVTPDGNPWVVTDKGEVYGYDGVNWHYVKGVLGRDITISNDYMTLVVGLDKAIYALNKINEITWTEISGVGLEISAGPMSQPWIVGSDNQIYDLSKRGYN